MGACPDFKEHIIVKSIFVFSRSVDGAEFISIGVAAVPIGCKTLGTFRTLEEARRYRDRMRREGSEGHPRGRNASLRL